jgi:hypothetical protein
VDLAAEESGRRYDAILAQVLIAEQYQRYQAEEARSTLHRQVRTAELAGHDPAALLTRAVGLRSLDADPYRGRAEDIARRKAFRPGMTCGASVFAVLEATSR